MTWLAVIMYQEFAGTHAEALSLSWSKNRVRRHLDSSQAAAAEALRAKLSKEYSRVVEKMKSEAQERKAEGQKSGGRGNKKLGGENTTTLKAPQESKKVREQRAAAAGT